MRRQPCPPSAPSCLSSSSLSRPSSTIHSDLAYIPSESVSSEARPIADAVSVSSFLQALSSSSSSLRKRTAELRYGVHCQRPHAGGSIAVVLCVDVSSLPMLSRVLCDLGRSCKSAMSSLLSSNQTNHKADADAPRASAEQIHRVGIKGRGSDRAIGRGQERGGQDMCLSGGTSVSVSIFLGLRSFFCRCLEMSLLLLASGL